MVGAEVRVVTDGGADLPGDMAERTGVSVVAGQVRLGGGEWSGGAEEFWRQVRADGAQASTRPPTVEQFSYAYDDLVGAGARRRVLSVHVSAELSRSVDHARSAAAGRPVEVVDSRSVSVGTGLLALTAAEAASSGASFDSLRAMAGGWVDDLHVHVVVDDPAYLVRGGHAGFLGGDPGHGPRRHILAVRGRVIPIGRTRHRADAVGVLFGHVREHVAEGAGRWAVGHGDARDHEQVVARLVDTFGTEPVFVTVLGPVTGAHLGPDALVVAFFTRG